MELTENQKAWVSALRSGEFKQGRDRLQTDDCYCCLGVLCVVAEKHGVEVNKHPDNTLIGLSLTDQSKVREWAGLSTSCGMFGGDDTDHLTELNDNGKSFAEIADIIEQSADYLFTHNVPN